MVPSNFSRTKVCVYARASIKFKSPEQIQALIEGIDGKIFTDNKGIARCYPNR